MRTILILIIFIIHHRDHHYYRITPTWHHPNKTTSAVVVNHTHPISMTRGGHGPGLFWPLKLPCFRVHLPPILPLLCYQNTLGYFSALELMPYIVFYKIKYSNYFPTAMCCFLVHLLSTNISIGTNEELPPATVKISFNQDSVLNL